MKDFLFDFVLPLIIPVYVIIVHTLRELLLRHTVTLGQILLSWCSLFFLFVTYFKKFRESLSPN